MEGTPYIVWLEDRNGDTVRCEGFDSIAELKKAWPHADRQSEHEYTAWIGGGR